MSRRVSELPRRLVKYDTEHSQYSGERMLGEGMMRRATTVVSKLPLDLEMMGMNQQQCTTNPFLKAKLKAYLSHLTTTSNSTESSRDRLHEMSPQSDLPLFQDYRVTFKDINQEVLSYNSRNAQQLSKKLQNQNVNPRNKH